MPRKRKQELPPIETGNETIGQKIARFRKEKALTQEELAQEIGITQTLISDYETGRLHLSDEMLIRFALSLDKSSDEILGLKNENGHEQKPSLRIMRRLKKIEELPEHQQKTILKSLDMMIDSAERK